MSVLAAASEAAVSKSMTVLDGDSESLPETVCLCVCVCVYARTHARAHVLNE